MAKAHTKTRHPRRKKRRQRRRAGSGNNVRLLVALIVLMAVAIGGYVAFDDRHWQAFNTSGDAAFLRHNHVYAEGLYRQALDEARRLKNRQLIGESLADLQRVSAAQGHTDEAQGYARELATLNH